MTFDQIWDALKARNAGLADETTRMDISVESFKRSMRQAYDMGEKHANEGRKASDKFADLFKGF